MMEKLANSKEGYYAALLFIIWPLLSAISAFKNYDKTWAKNIFWAFCAFYGFTFAIGSENQGSDIVRYVESYQNLHDVQMTFAGAVDYFAQSGQIDMLRIFIEIVLSRFTDSRVALTLIYGIIFGYFISRNLWYVIERLEGKLLPITILLLVCFFLENPIWKINGFRMWTATHVFLFGLLPYLFEGKKKWLWISCLSILVHYSFLVPVSVLFAYVFLGNRLTLYFCFYLSTFFISELDITAFNTLIENYAPEILQERSESYRRESQVEDYREGSSESSTRWYAVWYNRALSWSIMGFLVILFLKEKKFFEISPGWLSLFSFTLFFYGVANVFSSLPSGGRFFTVANLFALALIILYIQNRPREFVMKRFIYVTIPALLLYIIVAVRIGLYSMSATWIFGNPVIAMFLNGDHLSLNDVMRMII